MEHKVTGEIPDQLEQSVLRELQATLGIPDLQDKSGQLVPMASRESEVRLVRLARMALLVPPALRDHAGRKDPLDHRDKLDRPDRLGQRVLLDPQD
jgi:hypothetical protein